MWQQLSKNSASALFLTALFLIFQSSEAVLPPSPPHVCEPPYKGEIVDPYCFGVFRLRDIMCPWTTQTAEERTAMATRLVQLNPVGPGSGPGLPIVWANQGGDLLFRLNSSSTNIEFVDGHWIFHACSISNEQDKCLPSSGKWTFRVAGVGWLPGYSPVCADWRTGSLQPECLTGRFGPPSCSLTCQPVSDCGPHGQCVYRPGLLFPVCLCQPEYVGTACEASTQKCQTPLCHNRGVCTIQDQLVNVVLTRLLENANRVRLVQILQMQDPGLSSSAARNLLNNLPTFVKKRLRESDSSQLQQWVEAAGGVVRLDFL